MLKDEPRLSPPDYEDETLAKEIWVANMVLEVLSSTDKLADAIDWHGETYGNEDLNTVLAHWSVLEGSETDCYAAKRVKATTKLQGFLKAHAESYCEEVLYPEMKVKHEGR